MQGSKERTGFFGITCCDAAPLLKVQKGILNKMSNFIKMSVIVALFLPVFS